MVAAMNVPKRTTTLSLLHTGVFVLIVFSACITAGDYEPVVFAVDGDTATMTGVIDHSIGERVRSLRADHPQVTTIVMLDVPGSVDDEANLAAARLVRDYGYHTVVPANGTIASGGVDFFIAGVTRTAESGAMLGVHTWGSGWLGPVGADLPRDHPEHIRYLDYYAQMGVPAEFYWFTLEAAPVQTVHYMTAQELRRYGVVTDSTR